MLYDENHPQGPPLSEWERSDAALTDKFREEFPDGRVPVRHSPVHVTATHHDIADWAVHTLGILDAVMDRVKDVNACAELREQWRNTYDHTYGLEGSPQRVGDRRAAGKGLLAQGLTVTQAAHYVDIDPLDFVRTMRSGDGHPDFATEPAVDDAVMAFLRGEREEKSLAALARALNARPRLVERLARSHKGA